MITSLQKYQTTEKYKLKQAKFNKSEKRKLWLKEYRKSKNFKESLKKYQQTETFKIYNRKLAKVKRQKEGFYKIKYQRDIVKNLKGKIGLYLRNRLNLAIKRE